MHIPATVESIDPAFFQLFPNAASVEVDPANSAFTSLNGMLFSADLTILHLVPEGMEGVAVLPESLATVPAYVISRCKKLFGLTFLPSGSTGNSTFTAQDGVLYTSDKTTLVAAPAGLGASIAIAPECTAIAAGAFLGNEKPKTIIAMGKVAEIAAGSADAGPGNGGASGAAFEAATIEGATVITDDRAAWEAAGFVHFASPAEPGEVLAPAPGDSGFTYTLMENGQLSVKWTGEAPASGKRNIPSAATLHGVDYTVSVVEDGAFEGQDELTEIVLPDTITTIGTSAFAGCTALGSVQLAGSVTSIGASAFEGCASLGALDLGSGLRTIGERAFAGTALAELVLPAGVQSIGASVFAGCEQLVAIVAQSTISDVSEAALADVSGVSIYAPYEQDGQYAWNIGPVASANHLLAYGVSLPAIDLQLQAGQEGNLLDDGGYLEAPGDMTAQLSYNAKSISVDANGAVSAIQPGISTVTARLMLGELLLANATRTVRVSHAAALPAEGADAEGDVAEEAGTEDEGAESSDDAAESEDGSDADLTDPVTQPATTEDIGDTGELTIARPKQPYQETISLDTAEGATSTPTRPEIIEGECPIDSADPIDPIIGISAKVPLANLKQISDQILSAQDASNSGSEVEDFDVASDTLLASKAANTIALAASTARATYNNDCSMTIYANGGAVTAYWADGSWGHLGNAYKSASGTGSFKQTHHGNEYHNTWANCNRAAQTSGVLQTYACLTNTPSGTYVIDGTNLKRLIISASRTGYYFTKWVTGSNTGPGLVTRSDGNVNAQDYNGAAIYPTWTARTYDLILDDQGGSGGSGTLSNALKYDADTAPSSVKKPSRTGYVFKGYRTLPNGGGSLEYNEDARRTHTGNYTTASNLTLYADWDPIYTITLDPNGGEMPTGKPSSITYVAGQSDVPFYSTSTGVSGYKPTRSNALFVGWYCTKYDSTITDTHATSGKVYPTFYTNSSNYGNYTLKAVWRMNVTLNGNAPQSPKASTVTQNQVSLIYYTDFGFRKSSALTGSSWPSSGFYGKNSSLGVSVPTCSDAGWELIGYSLSNGSTYRLSDSMSISVDSITQHETWYAQWRGKSGPIYIDANGGSQPDTGQYGYTVSLNGYHYLYGSAKLPEQFYYYGSSSASMPIPTPPSNGWTFDGYYNGNTKYYENDGRGYLRACTIQGGIASVGIRLTAKWVRNITLNANGSKYITAAAPSGSSTTTIQITYNEQLPNLGSEYVGISAPEDPRKGTNWTLKGYYAVATNPNSTQYYNANGIRKYTSLITSGTSPSTIYAMWERTVAIDANGGNLGDTTKITYLKGNQPPKITDNCYWDGRTLVGYFGAETGGTQYYDEYGDLWDTGLTNTIYAQWKADAASIEFDVNAEDATGGPEVMKGVTGEKIDPQTMPSQRPKRPNYDFIGWYTDKDSGNEVTALPAEFPIGTVTYYAHWEKAPLSKITYTTEQGDLFWLQGHSSDNVGSSKTFEVERDTGQAPTIRASANGWDISGWWPTSSTDGSPLEFGDTLQLSRPEGGWPAESSYIAKFTIHNYAITYTCRSCNIAITSDGCRHVKTLEGLPTSFTIQDLADHDSYIRIPQPTMKPYYTFKNWDGSGGSVHVGGAIGNYADIIKAADGNAVINVEAEQYKLELDAGKGDWEEPLPEGYSTGVGTGDHHTIQKSYTVDDDAFQLPIPKWAGHTFAGWKRQGVSVGNTFIPGVTEEGVNWGNIIYTATWSTNAYQITYDLADELGTGFLPDNEGISYSYDVDSGDITLPIPSRVGYDFIGWTETIEEEDPPSGLAGQSPVPAVKGDNPQIDVTIPTGSWGDRIYKAHWRAHEYNIAYDLDGGAWEDPQPDNPQVATHDQDVVLAKAPKRAGYLFQGWQFVRTEGDVQAIERYEAGQSLTRPNFTAQVGEPAYEGVSANKGATATIEAMWLPNLSVDVVVGSQGVHMGLQLKTDPDEPFETTRGEAVLKNRSDAPLKVVEVAPNSTSDYEALKESALELFLTEESLEQAAFMVRPSKGSAANTQSGWFGIADPAGSLVLRDDIGLNSPTPNCPRNWYMGTANESTNELKLYYQLDMGDLRPEDVDVSEDKSLHVADLRYTVALVLP